MTKASDRKKISLIGGLWINDRTYNIRILAVLMAMEVLLAYSPFGYIVLPTISVTTLFIGVLASALWGGPFFGAVVGLVFGITSMWKASVTAVNPNDLIFSPIRSGDPMGSVILALAPRILFGIIAGLVYYAVMRLSSKRSKVRVPLILLASALLERVHSMLVYLFMDKIFHVEGASMWKAWHHLFSANRIQTFCVTILVLASVYCFYDIVLSKKYYEQYLTIKDLESKINVKYTVMMIIAMVVVFLTGEHLWERIKIILFDIDQLQPEITHLGLIAQVIIQFMAASISAIYVIVVIYRHARYVQEVERTEAVIQLELAKARANEMENQALKDPLTGAYNRKGLEKVLAEESFDGALTGFGMIDIDYFKEINDTCGHDAGDTILKETARMLEEFFGENRVFRLGGDEFAVLVRDDQNSSPEVLQEKWEAMTCNFEKMHSSLSAMLSESVPLTLSAGLCLSDGGFSDKWYSLADYALYETKRNGRAGCTVVDQNGKTLISWNDPKGKLHPRKNRDRD